MTSAAEIIHATSIGSSEIAAICGVSPFGDAWTVYARKKGLIGDQEQTEQMFWGKLHEPLIAGVVAHRMEFSIKWWDQKVWSTKRAWQHASPDALILTEPQKILEIKTSSAFLAREWDDDVTSGADGIPEHYLLQVEWQLSTLELEEAYLAVLIGGNQLRIYHIEHDPYLEEILLETGEKFWREYLSSDSSQVPPIGGSERATKYLKERYPWHKKAMRAATLREAELLGKYAQVRRESERIEAQKTTLENQLFDTIAEAEGLEWAGGTMTWKRTSGRRETKWKELGRELLVGYSAEEQDGIIQRYTRVVEGYRRINWTEKTDA